jgi:hypothetical protein
MNRSHLVGQAHVNVAGGVINGLSHDGILVNNNIGAGNGAFRTGAGVIILNLAADQGLEAGVAVAPPADMGTEGYITVTPVTTGVVVPAYCTVEHNSDIQKTIRTFNDLAVALDNISIDVAFYKRNPL